MVNIMKKLSKKLHVQMQTLEAYCSCSRCDCACKCDSYGGQESSAEHTYTSLTSSISSGNSTSQRT
jgi:putative bacteriocin precursor